MRRYTACVSYARAHADSHVTGSSIASHSRRRLPPRRSRSEIHVGVQSLDGQSAARDAKARKAKVKIALLAPYTSRMCSTIDLSRPNVDECGAGPSMATKLDPRIN